MTSSVLYTKVSGWRVASAAVLLTSICHGGDWSAWRGPNANGIAESGQEVPTEWSESENILWNAPIPGRGHSSPTVYQDRIYLATADERNQVQGIIALDRETGKQAWICKLSEGGFPKTHAKNTHATCTVACDGECLFVTFHHHNKLTLHAVSLEGQPEWFAELGPYHPQKYEYGYAPSPVLYGPTVIVAADVEHGGFLAAYDRQSGEQLWRQPRPNLYSFSSPIIAHVAGRDQLLISGCNLVSSYDPATGQPLWSVEGTTMATCGTMVWDGDAVFASGGYPDPQTIAVKADGSKQVLWRNRQKCYEQSMLAHDGYVYAITDQGIAFCWRASDGQEMWKQRLSGPVSSSPVLVDDTIYATNEKGTTYVFKANPQEFVSVATNKLGDEGFATMSVADSRIYLRTAHNKRSSRQEVLYCIGRE